VSQLTAAQKPLQDNMIDADKIYRYVESELVFKLIKLIYVWIVRLLLLPQRFTS